MTKIKIHPAGISVLVAVVIAGAAPAGAQNYPYPPRQGGVAGEIQRGTATAADAVSAVAQALRGTRESLSVGACQYRAARYGQARVLDVRPKGRRDLVVRGVIEPMGNQSAWGSRYDKAYQRRTFTCTVRQNGDVRKFKTKRIK
ncbi:MAG: hypothetical protein H0W74_12810 [Sphingosinicella sp.]|nr:hypothetical protein [Sphingosinicella sp.]